MLNVSSEVIRVFSNLTCPCELVSATFSTWSEVCLHMKEYEIPVLPTDPLIKGILADGNVFCNGSGNNITQCKARLH